MMKSFTHTVMGEFDAAEQLQQQAAAIAEETGRPATVSPRPIAAAG